VHVFCYLILFLFSLFFFGTVVGSFLLFLLNVDFIFGGFLAHFTFFSSFVLFLWVFLYFCFSCGFCLLFFFYFHWLFFLGVRNFFFPFFWLFSGQYGKGCGGGKGSGRVARGGEGGVG